MIVSGDQRPEWFALAGGLLGQDYRHDLGHKVITAVGADGKPTAFAVLTDVVPGMRAEVTVWAKRSRGLAGRAFLQAVFGTVFTQWRCRRLTAIVRKDNVPSVRAVVALGFHFETPLKAWFGDADGLCFYMLPADCRWLPSKVTP